MKSAEKVHRSTSYFLAVAALSKVLVANNRTDKDDEPDLEFDKIVPQNFEPTDDRYPSPEFQNNKGSSKTR